MDGYGLLLLIPVMMVLAALPSTSVALVVVRSARLGVTHGLWVAAGIGVTPFLAWLEELQNHPEQVPTAQMHYCTHDGSSDPMVPRLQQLCDNLKSDNSPGISLHIHDSQKGQKITPEDLLNRDAAKKVTEVWYCGPKGLARLLETGLKKMLPGSLRFRKEAFEFR